MVLDAGGNLRHLRATDGTELAAFPTFARHDLATLAPRGPGWSQPLVFGRQGMRLRFQDGARPSGQLALAADGVRAVACCPETNTLATGDRDGVIQLWDADSGRVLHGLEGHTAAVTALAFSPDGRRLVSGAADGTLCVWEPSAGRELVRLDGPPRGPSALAFWHGGSSLLVARGSEITESPKTGHPVGGID
jgi:WD40 repeat protein